MNDKVAPVVASVASTDPTDCGVADGTITITASSPNGSPIQYSIDGGQTWDGSGAFTGLDASGNPYEIRVRNADGTCIVVEANVNLTDRVQPVVSNVGQTNPTQCGVNDGTITITASGASNEYSIDGGLNWQPSGNFTGLGSGTFNISVRNTDGTCQILYAGNPVILTSPNAPSIINISSTNPTDCGNNDGSINITATGGSGFYQYSIDSGTTYQPANVFNNLAAGTYTIFVSNSDGTCPVAGQTVTLDEKVAPVIANVTFTDPTDCGLSDGTITILASSSIGNSLEFSIDGGATYQASNVFSGLDASGNPYQIRVRNADGTCIQTGANITITDKIEPVITNVLATSPTDCNTPNGSIVITATGISLEYSIDGGVNWQSSASFTGLGAGTYNVFVRNLDGSCQVADANNPYILTAPNAAIITNVASTDPTDCGVADGTITITASGGINPLQYSIDNGSTWLFNNGLFTGLAGGTYNTLVRNADNSCVTTGPIEVLEDKVAPTITNVVDASPSDCGVVDGSIVITANSSVGATLQYSIDAGSSWQQSEVFSGLAGGTYQIVVRNIDGTCQVTAPNVTLTDKVLPTIASVVATDPANCGTNDGSIVVTASGGGALEYSLNGGVNWQLSGNFTGLGAGVYDITVRNIDGTCEVVYVGNSIILTAPNAPSIANVSTTNPTECNVTDGTITVTATGGSGLYQYSIDSGTTYQISNSFANLAGGNYTVFVRNSDSTCAVLGQTVTLDDKAAPVIASVVKTDPTDCGFSDGTITITASSTSGSVEYSIDGGSTYQPSNVFSGLTGGLFDIRVRNIDGTCEVTSPAILIVDPVVPVINNVTATSPDNCSNPNGSIIVDATGNTLEYSIDGGLTWQVSDTFTNLSNGNYYISVRNTNGTCEVLDANNPYQLIAPAAPAITNVASTDPTDCGSNDGTINVTATGGQGSYLYSIDSGSTFTNTTGSFSNLAGGTYHIFISNADGSCVTTGSIEVLEEKAAPVIANVIVDDISDCGVVDAQITILASSAQGSIEYSIDGGTTFQPANIFVALPAGNYDIVVRNIDGSCEITYPTVTITAPVAPSIVSVTPTDPTDCSVNNGTITINTTPSSGVEFSIDGGFTWAVSNVFTGLPSGNYQIAIRNTTGTCQVNSTTISLTAPAAPSIVNVARTHPTDCDSLNGTITITASGGSGTFEYSIDSGSTWQLSNSFGTLASGDYYVFIRNAADGSCPVTNPTVTLTAPAAPTIDAIAATDPSDCGLSDGTITITATSPNGSVQYSIDGGSTWQPSNVFINQAGGSYTVAVSNINGSCVVVNGQATILTNPVQPTITNVTSNNPSDCNTNDGTITITSIPNTGVEYSIDGGVVYQASNIFTGLTAGTYTIAIRNDNGTCEVQSPNQETLTAPNAPIITAVATSDPQFCGINDGTITITATPGSGVIQYSADSMQSWQPFPSFAGLSAGTYYLFVRNLGGTCVTSYPPVTLSEGPISPSDYASQQIGSVNCIGDTLTYVLRNVNGQSFASYTVTPSAGFISNTFTGDSLVIKFFAVSTGLVNYDIQVTNALGCIYQENINFTAQAGPSIVAQDQGECLNTNGTYPLDGSLITINGNALNGNNTVLYSSTVGTFTDPTDPNTDFIPTTNASGNYVINVRVTDANGCPGFTALTYEIISAPAVNIPDQTICQGGSALLSASGGINYIWSVISGDASSLTSTTSNTILVSPTVTTVYEVTATTADGCSVTSQVTVTVNATLALDNPVTSANVSTCGTCDGQVVIDVQNGTAPFIVQYDSAGTITQMQLIPNANGELILTGLCAGDYTSFVVTDANGCSVSDPSLGNTYSITEPGGPIINFVTTTNTSTCSQCDGQLIVNLDVNNLGAAPYTVSFDSLGTIVTRTGLTLTNGNQIELTGLCDGFYNSITITDATGCASATSFGPFQIEAPTGLQLGSGGVTTADPATCVSCDGEVRISIDGSSIGVAPYTVQFDSSSVTVTRTGLQLDGSLNIILTGLCSGDYENLVITDAGGCPISTPVPLNGPYTINQPNAPVTVGGVQDIDLTNCSVCDGELRITLNGTDFSTQPYTLTYDSLGITVVRTGLTLNVNSQIVLDGLCEGAYTDLQIVDNNGCTVFAPFPINGPFDIDQPATVTLFGGLNATDVTACNSCDGEIALGVTGGTLPYTVTYEYNGAQNSVQIFAINANSELIISNLCAGEYTNFTVADASSCFLSNPTLTGPVLVGEPNGPTVQSVVIENASCFASDGTIILNTVGTPSNYNFAWAPNLGQPNATGNIRTELPAGTYTITMSDPTTGCDTSIMVALSNTDGPDVTVNTTKATCGAADGLAVLAPNTLTYTWSDAGTGNLRSDLTPGIYFVTATDGTCASILQVEIGDTSLITATAAINSLPSDCNMPDGSAVVNAFGGNAPYTYTWSDALVQTNQGLFVVRNDLLAGTYTVTVEDANGCEGIAQFILLDNDTTGTTLDITGISNVSCPGADDGTINYVTSIGNGFVGSPVITITDGISNYTNGNLPAGDYCVELRDANGCVLVAACTTIVAPNTIVAIIDVTNETCTGNDGIIDLTITGGTAPFTYNWSDGSSNEDITTAIEGTYSVTITDANGCSVTVGGNNAINVGNDCSCEDLFMSGITTINSLCGLNTGYAEVNVIGGSGVYTYQWSAPAISTTNSASNLASGTYTVTITDADGCELIQIIQISDGDGPDIGVSNVTDAICEISGGSILLAVNTGNAPFTIRWYGAGSDTVSLASLGTYTMSNLDDGTYYIEVMDANGCISNLTENVGLSSGGLSLQTTINDAACPNGTDGSITMIVTGGSNPFEYQLINTEDPNNVMTQFTNVTVHTFNNLVAGVYIIQVSDNAGCLVSDTVTINETGVTLNLNDLVISDISCNDQIDGSVTLANSGNTTIYTLYDLVGNVIGNVPQTGLTAGIYVVETANAQGCVARDIVTIGRTGTWFADVDVIPEGCVSNSGMIRANVHGGAGNYTFAWSNGDNTQLVTGLAAGTYSVTITDGNSCSYVVSDIILDNDCACTLDVAGAIIKNANCGDANGTIEALISGGEAPYTYNWSSNVTSSTDNIASGLMAGIYGMTVTDAGGCSDSVILVVSHTEGPGVAVVGGVDASCGANDGTIVLDLTSTSTPFDITWTGPVSGSATDVSSPYTINGLASGDYQIGVAADDGCETFTQQTVREAGTLSVTSASTGDDCDVNNSTGTITVTTTGATLPVQYYMDGLLLAGTGASNTISSLDAGIYNMTVVDGSGCDTSFVITVDNDGVTPIDFSDFNIANVTCVGDLAGSITYTGSENVQFVVIDDVTGSVIGSLPVTSLPVGSYILQRRENGCVSSAPFNISGPNNINVTFSAFQESCIGNDGAIVAVVTGATAPYTFAWSNGAPNSNINSNLTAGDYTVTITDANGCQIIRTVTVTNDCDCNLSIIGTFSTQPNCGTNDGSIQIRTTGGVAPYIYTWTNNVSSTNDASGLTAGVYTVIVTDAAGCVDSTTVALSSLNGPQLSTTITPATCTQSDGAIEVRVNSGAAPFTYSYLGLNTLTNGQNVTNSSTINLTNLPADVYRVIIIDANGCVTILPGEVVPANSNTTFTSVVTDASCGGGQDGIITISPTGGTLPFTYFVNGNPTSNPISGLGLGVYEVMITDGNGCSATDTVIVNEGGADILLTDFTITDPTCAGATDGTITYTGAPTNTVYSITNQFGNIIGVVPNANLGAGNYILQATIGGCSTVEPFTINPPELWDIVMEIDQDCENGSSLTANVLSGGSGTFFYNWSDGSNTSSIANANAGIYDITVSDNAGCSITGTGFTIEPCNDTINVTVPVDSSITYCVDTSELSNIVSVQNICVGAVNNGGVVVNNDGCIDFMAGSVGGTDTVCLVICDSLGLCDTTIVVFNIEPVTDTIEVTIPSDSTQVICLDTTQLPGNIASVTNLNCATIDDGTVVSIGADGCITYTGASTVTNGTYGLDTLCIEICDDQGICDTTILVIQVVPENTPPVAINDINVTMMDSTIIGNVLTNDYDIDGDSITVTLLPYYGPANGTVVMNGDSTYSYTPNNGFVGTDVFAYIICDNGTPGPLCDTAIVTITIVNPIIGNEPPVANPDDYVTLENTVVTGSIISNDNDPDGDNITINTTPVSTPDNGIVTINANGTFEYTPTNGFIGIDSFEYVICDDGIPSLCDTTVVRITVLPNTPDNNPPFTNSDFEITPVNTGVGGDLIVNDGDPDGDNITINTTPMTNPANGTVTINSDGTYNYIPNTDFVGTDQFTYQICDDGTPQLCAIGTAYILVLPENNPPVAVNDFNNTYVNTDVSGNASTNDYDVDNDNLLFTLLYDGNNGTVTLSPTGTYNYVPNTDFTGTDQFTYIICDDGIPGPLCDTATVTIEVFENSGDHNDPPVANNDVYSILAGNTVNGNMISNDADPNFDNITVNIMPLTQPMYGNVVISGNGTFSYTNTSGTSFSGVDSFQYVLCDDGNPILCDTATVYIDVMPDMGGMNNPPLANTDAVIIEKNDTANGNVLINDSDPDGDNLIVTTSVVSGPSNGTVTLNSDGTYQYIPTLGFTGNDEFVYEICDDGTPSLCATGTVVITVIDDNDPPVANNDIANVLTDSTFTGNVLTNDYDPDGDNLTVDTTLAWGPANGTVTIDTNGVYTYVPNAGFEGSDTFAYVVCDNGTPGPLCDTAIVSIQVFNNSTDNDAPIANNDQYQVIEGNVLTTGTVMINDFDPDGDNLTFSVLTMTPNGTLVPNPDGSFTYLPNAGFVGTDSFTYVICDDGTPSLCDTAVVIIDVLPVPDENLPPFAGNDATVTLEDTPVSGDLLVNDFDPDGDNITINTTPIDLPDNGQVIISSNGTYIYTPNPGFVGTDQFVYEICDNGTPSLCTQGTAIITVLPITNTPPVAINDIMNVQVGDTAIGNVLTNDFDLDGDSLFVITTPLVDVANGTLTLNDDGTYEYVPDATFEGTDQFTYIVCDDGNPVLCDTATVVIEVFDNDNGENDAPIANDDLAQITEGGILNINIISNDDDPDGDNITINQVPVTLPVNGVVLITNTGDITYVPNPGFTGTDSFEYVICDDGIPSLCDTAQVVIDVLPIAGSDNHPPVAGTDAAIIFANDTATGNLLANDSDPDGHNITINTVPVTTPSNGTVTILPNGDYVYIPNTGFSGTDQFTYEICDDGNPVMCSEGTAIINVLPITNTPPVAINDIMTTLVDSTVTGNVLTNDYDLDGDNLSVNTTPVYNVSNGTLTLLDDGTYTYVPVVGFVGTDSFSYVVCDNGSPVLCDTAVVTINVLPIPNGTDNNPPTANDDAFTITEGNTLAGVSITSNDFDIDGDNIIITTTPITTPSNGNIVIAANGDITYVPNANFIGTDSFDYVICDDGTPSLCDTATVYVTVVKAADNNPPFAGTDADLIYEGDTSTGNLLANDGDPDGDNVTINTTPVTTPANGTVTILPNGDYVYVPNLGFSGTDQFIYEICDDGTPVLCSQGTAIITILPLNHAPVAVNDTFYMAMNDTLNGSVILNDFDPDGDMTTVTQLDSTTNGSLTVNSDGSFVYIPNNNFIGVDTFTYILCDNGLPSLCDTATVYIFVEAPDCNIFSDTLTFCSFGLYRRHRDLCTNSITTNPKLPNHGRWYRL